MTTFTFKRDAKRLARCTMRSGTTVAGVLAAVAFLAMLLIVGAATLASAPRALDAAELATLRGGQDPDPCVEWSNLAWRTVCSGVGYLECPGDPQDCTEWLCSFGCSGFQTLWDSPGGSMNEDGYVENGDCHEVGQSTRDIYRCKFLTSDCLCLGDTVAEDVPCNDPFFLFKDCDGNPVTRPVPLS